MRLSEIDRPKMVWYIFSGWFGRRRRIFWAPLDVLAQVQALAAVDASARDVLVLLDTIRITQEEVEGL